MRKDRVELIILLSIERVVLLVILKRKFVFNGKRMFGIRVMMVLVCSSRKSMGV